MLNKKRIYLASPYGFSEAGRLFLYDKIIPLFIRCGLEIIDPWELTPEEIIRNVSNMSPGPAKKTAWSEVNMVIADNNAKGIDLSDGLFTVLDGTDVDSGTASEIGYAFARKKPITAYRGDFRLAGDNEGSTVNLQVEYFVRLSGGRIITSLNEIEDELV